MELIDDSVEAAVASLGTARIAYERGAFCGWPCFGDLWVYEVSSGSRRRLGTGHPVIFSPDGSELLVTQPSSATEIVSVADGTSRVVQPGLSEAAPSAVRWEADGIRELFGVTTNSAVAEFWIRNLATGENRKVYEWRGAAWPTGHAWAPDGSRFVVWLRECEPEPYQTYDWGCPSHEALYLVDPATGRDTWIVGGDGGHVGDAAVFSPDAKRIAYIFGALRLTSMP